MGVLDAEGFAICPKCYSHINCGTAGLKNLALHQGKGTCKKAQDKHNQEGKKKNMSILSFMKTATPKSSPIPSTINHSEPIHSQKLPPASSTIIPTSLDAPSTEEVPTFILTSTSENAPSKFLEKLHDLIVRILPSDITISRPIGSKIR